MFQTDFRNSNGLVNGMIPANCICPFIETCGFINRNCPDHGFEKSGDFYCSVAATQSALKNTEH